ncbi:MAG: hypothetical protein HY717_00585 [Planctomycetes bacterium]|nr:hypothetical protein [Planctomycetota bacterium]
MKRSRSQSGTPGILVAAGLAALFAAPAALGPVALGQGNLLPAAIEPVPEVEFSLDTVSAERGGLARLTLWVRTSVPLKALAVALDFEEEKLQAGPVGRAAEFPGALNPVGVISTTSFNNLDLSAGNQVSEGWLYAEIDTGEKSKDLGIPVGVLTPVLTLEFTVSSRAALGFSPVRFAKVGPVVSPAPLENYYNKIEEALSDHAPAALPEDSLEDGGVDIIGEVGFFMRGDANFNQERDISDPITILSYLFNGGANIPCADAADGNDDGDVDIADAIFTLGRLFLTPDPFPEPDEWGRDPTEDWLGCAVYPGH